MRTQRQNRTPSKNRVRYQRQETWSKKTNSPKEQASRFQKANRHLHIHAPEETGKVGKQNSTRKQKKGT